MQNVILENGRGEIFGTPVKVVALMRWECQAGDQEKYWQGWQWDGKPGPDHECTELAVGRKARSGS